MFTYYNTNISHNHNNTNNNGNDNHIMVGDEVRPQASPGHDLQD